MKRGQRVPTTNVPLRQPFCPVDDIVVTTLDRTLPAPAVARPAGVVFDIDGTLAVASSVHLDALGAAASEVLGVPAVFEMRGEKPYLNGTLVAGWVDAQCITLLAKQAGADDPTACKDVLQVYADRYQRLLADGASAGTLVPGAAEALDRLAEAEIPMGLSTGNAAAIAKAKLTALGVGDYFTFDDSAGFGDTHPNRGEVAAAAVAALPAARTVYLVGDTAADMRAAILNGVYGVGVCTGAETGPSLLAAGAATVLADVRDLPGLLGLTRPGAGRWLPAYVPGVTSAADVWFETR